jgi:hypothetical protein
VSDLGEDKRNVICAIFEGTLNCSLFIVDSDSIYTIDMR